MAAPTPGLDPRERLPDPEFPQPAPQRFCPRCKSDNIRLVEYLGVLCVICNDCGYDERQQYEIYPEERGSQREKGRFTPYKVGGARRTAKK